MKKLLYNIGLSMAVMVGCTDKFAEVNTNPTQPAAGALTDAQIIDGHMKNAFTWGLMEAQEYQRTHSLYAHLYAQYFATVATYFASDRYTINHGWLEHSWVRFYPNIMGSLATVINHENVRDEEKAIARIWKVFLFQRYVTLYGDIPYFNVLDADLPETYDPQPKIYDDFFKELKAAVDILKAPSATNALQASDRMYRGDKGKWVKFANSLRLRLALRISKADPTRAKTEAEAAIAGGVFESNEDNAYFPVTPTNHNALNYITGWNEFRMSATMESLLAGYNDPRLEIFFSPASDTASGYSGIRNGLSADKLGSDAQDKNSNVGPKFAKNMEGVTSRIVLTYAEQCFLLAEAKLNNGWMVGEKTAEEWYKNGIKASLDQFSSSDFAESEFAASSSDIESYIQGTSLPTTPGGEENAGLTRGISTLPVKWATGKSDQREQIGIQKWLALWPDGLEAWAEFRRTGFPKLYPVASIQGPSDVKEGDFIQRVTYIDSQKALFPDAINAASTRMGGDLQATKLYFAGGK